MERKKKVFNFWRGKWLFTLTMFVLLMVLMSLTFSCVVAAGASRFNGYVIVIDAGHGGRDGGSVGVGGTVEKTLNLKYAFALKEILTEKGYRVVMTRSTDDGLYSELAKNKKMSDLNARLKIIRRANPNLVVSIHMNKFSDGSVYGANTFFRAGDADSEACADYIQNALHTYCDAPNIESKAADYYILNNTYYTSVLVECGFLSNAEEEAKLNDPEYMALLTNSIYYGILLYFGDSPLSV